MSFGSFSGDGHLSENLDRSNIIMSKTDIPYGPERKPWIETLSDLAVSAEGHMLVSAPSRDPLSQYAGIFPAGTKGEYYQVPSCSLTKTQQERAHDSTLEVLSKQVTNFLGYQVNMCMPQYPEQLKPYLGFHSNNIGDPFTAGAFTVNTKWLECNVLDYYASLWNGKWPFKLEDPETYWGYVLTMGSTEGNLYAAWNARDYLSGKYLYYDPRAIKRAFENPDELSKIPYGFRYGKARFALGIDDDTHQNENALSPVVFYSEDTHYSNIKAAETIDIPTFAEVGTEKYPGENPLDPGNEWPAEVPSKDGALGPGSIDIDALATLVDFFTAKGHPVYIVLNYGSTFKGSYDNVEEVGKAIIPILKKNKMYKRRIVLPDDRRETRNGFWIHVDGALGASYMPFVEMAAKSGLRDHMTPGPMFDFRLDFVCSIVTSGHKWIGAPMPCGVYLMRNKYRIKPPDDTPIYVGSPDTTFAGSRNALSSAILWMYISTHSYEEQVKKVLRCIDLAHYAYAKLKKLEKDIGQKLWVTHSVEYSLSVYFKQPNEEIIRKYSLSDEVLAVGKENRKYSHMYLMQHVTFGKIDEMIKDMHQDGAFPEQDTLKAGNEAMRWLDAHPNIVLTKKEPCHYQGKFVPSGGRGFK